MEEILSEVAGLPRARGDGPLRRIGRVEIEPASPRPRGWTASSLYDPGPWVGFPAPAGMDLWPGFSLAM